MRSIVLALALTGAVGPAPKRQNVVTYASSEAFRIIDPRAIVAPANAEQGSVAVPLDDVGATYVLKKLVASSADPFCIYVAEMIQGGAAPRIFDGACLPGGTFTSTYDHGETSMFGGPGHQYLLVVSRPPTGDQGSAPTSQPAGPPDAGRDAGPSANYAKSLQVVVRAVVAVTR